MSLQKIPEGPLRTGYTTGACATACSKAALQALLTQKDIKEVEILLPAGERARFEMKSCSFSEISSTCTTIKDAGDDPDVTHKAEIGATVSLNDQGELKFLRGDGVGLVTLPGLAIPVGEPAINPVPREMIKNELDGVLKEFGLNKGVSVEVFVVNGKEIAKKTLNSRLGIVDGISILGTTGIVKPFSASAYIASIVQGIDVALANGALEIVINSGGRSEKLLKSKFSYLPDFAFIQYGNWIGETLEKIADSPLRKFTVGIMIGKAVKLAQGQLNTHSGESSWSREFIHELAVESGYSLEVCQQVLKLNMARRLVEIFPFNESEVFYRKLAHYCANTISNVVKNVPFNLILIDAENRFIKYKGDN